MNYELLLITPIVIGLNTSTLTYLEVLSHVNQLKLTRGIFKLKSKVSEKALLAYDFYYSDGPIFISPRLASLISCHDVFGLMFNLLTQLYL
jgi:hypothetical protein